MGLLNEHSLFGVIFILLMLTNGVNGGTEYDGISKDDEFHFVLDEYNDVFSGYDGFPLRNNDNDLELVITENQEFTITVLEIINNQNDIPGDEIFKTTISLGDSEFQFQIAPSYSSYILSTYWEYWESQISIQMNQLVLKYQLFDFFTINRTADEFIIYTQLNSSSIVHQDHSRISELIVREVRFNLNTGVLDRDFYYYFKVRNSSNVITTTNAFYILRNDLFSTTTPLPLDLGISFAESERNNLTTITKFTTIFILFEIIIMIRLLYHKRPHINE